MLFYLPIETSRRELVAKIFTAAALADKGYPVAVFKSNLFELNGWPSPGVYIGKNCFRNAGFGKERHYDRIRESGIRVWHLDEEGGVYVGTSEDEWRKILLKRLNPAALQKDDRIFTWGEWQRQALLELEPECPVSVTGSPNFDMFDSRYSHALSDFDRIETGGRENFILINTRFSLSNGLISIKRHLQDDSPVAQHVDKRSLRRWIGESGILQYSFISLVQRLSEALPDDEIVLRPHPAEDPELYRDLLAGWSNVSVEWRGDVGSWIRRCRALIHNGCTTAVQAQIAGKPVITYLPINEADYLMPGLPNLIGEKCRTVSAVLEALETNSAADAPASLGRTISTAGAINEFLKTVVQECAPPAGPRELEEIMTQVEKAAQRGGFREARKRLKRQLFPKEKYANKGRKFDAGFFARGTEVFAAAKKCFEGEMEILSPSDECFLVMPRGSNSQ